MIIKKILLLWFNNSVLYLRPYCTQIKCMYRNMYLNYCIKHAKKKLQMDYQNLEGIQSLKGVAGSRFRVKENKVSRFAYQIPNPSMATEQPVSGTDDPNHGTATSPSTSLSTGLARNTVFTS